MVWDLIFFQNKIILVAPPDNSKDEPFEVHSEFH